MIVVHNNLNGTATYDTVDDLIASTQEWMDENGGECQMDVTVDDQLIFMTHVHFDFDDGDTVSVIIKSELPESVNVDDLIERLNAFG